MASIRITSMESFEDQDASGTLVLVHPDDTPRPISHWSVPRWWDKSSTRTVYAHCARVDDTANNVSIYIASSTRFPKLLIEESGGSYTFDSDKTREHINRIWVTDDATLKTGDDYICPLRRGNIVLSSSTRVLPPPPPIGAVTGIDLVATTSIETNGTFMLPTVTTSGTGSGMTVFYDVVNNVATAIRVNKKGTGYEVGDTFDVYFDTGVKGRVAAIE